MKGRNENKNTRNAGLVDFYNRNKAEIIPKEGLNESWMKFIGLHTEVNSKDRISKMGNKGRVKSKSVAREEVHVSTLLVGGAVYSYGVDSKNQELITYFDFDDAYLREERDMDFLNITKTTLSTANLNVVNLAKFDITPEILMDYETKVNDYEVALGRRVSGQKEVKTVNEQIEDLLHQMDEVIHTELNKRMLPFMKSNPTLYTEYLHLREISDEGIRHEEEEPAAEGTVTEGTTTEQPK